MIPGLRRKLERNALQTQIPINSMMTHGTCLMQGGTDTATDYKWNAVIWDTYTGKPVLDFPCAVLAADYILTTAQACNALNTNLGRYHIRAGMGHDVSDLTYAVDRVIHTAYPHEQYGSPTMFDNDIGYIYPEAPFTLYDTSYGSDYEIRPIDLAAYGSDFTGQNVTLEWWGKYNPGASAYEDTLQEIVTQVQSTSVSAALMSAVDLDGYVTDNMLGVIQPYGGGCGGNALMIATAAGGCVLAGLHSWGSALPGYTTVDIGYPQMQVRVANYIGWITANWP
jgi:hypothetical protein